MSQPALASPAPAPFLRRAFEWWLVQVKHALPPTIFFFIGFNLILVTKRLILQEHGVEFSGFLTATLAALLVGARFAGDRVSARLIDHHGGLVLQLDGSAPIFSPRSTRLFIVSFAKVPSTGAAQSSGIETT